MKVRLTTQVKVAALIIVIVELIGIAGIMLLEKRNLSESFYITTMLITAIGADGFVPMSVASRIFTALISFVGVGAVISAVVLVFGPIIFLSVKEASGMGRIKTDLKNHFIVCGYNATAKAVIAELSKLKKEFIIVDNDLKEVNHLVNEGLPAVHGDATELETLRKLNVGKAHALISAEDEDVLNALIVLTARRINPSLRIVAKVAHEENVQKLETAGASEVICPSAVGGKQLVELAVSE